jgi:hypothetical protein
MGTAMCREIETDELIEALMCRNQDVEDEKRALIAENDALAADNIELRRQLISMRAA